MPLWSLWDARRMSVAGGSGALGATARRTAPILQQNVLIGYVTAHNTFPASHARAYS